MVLVSILLATLAVSALSLSSVFVLGLRAKQLQRVLILLVSLSAGTLMGAAFLHLLPEAVEHFEHSNTPFVVLLTSFAAFFVLEKYLHWQHCHDAECEVHSFGYVNLVGDGIHNFLDGLMIAAAFSTSIEVGIAATLAIALHEIPQEISDFGVLLHAGFSKSQALAANFGVALMSMAGGVVGYFLAVSMELFVPYLVAIAAGAFLYISSSDLIPEIRREKDLKKSSAGFVFFVIGLILMYLMSLSGVDVH